MFMALAVGIGISFFCRKNFRKTKFFIEFAIYHYPKIIDGTNWT